MKILVTALSLMLGLSLLLTINCRPIVHECIPLKQAENIVLYKIVRADTMEWDTTKIRVYELPYMLERGDTINILKLIGPYEECKDTMLVLRDDCWYFFIDDAPLLDWGHPCRHVFIYCYCGGVYEVINSVYMTEYYYEMTEIRW